MTILAAAIGVDAEELSRLERLPPAVLRLWQYENAAASAVAAAAASAALVLPFPGERFRLWVGLVLAAVVVLAVVEALVLVPRRHRLYRYGHLEDCVVVRRGSVVLRRQVFPLDQVLYVETRRGPLARRFGLATVVLGTIADRHPVGPLAAESAEALALAVQRRLRPGVRGRPGPPLPERAREAATGPTPARAGS